MVPALARSVSANARITPLLSTAILAATFTPVRPASACGGPFAGGPDLILLPIVAGAGALALGTISLSVADVVVDRLPRSYGGAELALAAVDLAVLGAITDSTLAPNQWIAAALIAWPAALAVHGFYIVVKGATDSEPNSAPVITPQETGPISEAPCALPDTPRHQPAAPRSVDWAVAPALGLGGAAPYGAAAMVRF
jgi:hypothetical protein